MPTWRSSPRPSGTWPSSTESGQPPLTDLEGCVHQLFERQAALTPEAPAVVCGKRALTFGELDRLRPARPTVAASGRRPGAMRGRHPRSVGGDLVAVFGILKAGVVYVPLDHALPPARLKAIVAASGVRLVVTQTSLVPRCAALPLEVVVLDDRSPSQVVDGPVNGGAYDDGAAYVLHTSGSTGRPKGVVVSHRAVVALWSALRTVVGEPPGGRWRVSLNAPLTFDDASVKQWTQLLSGHTVVVIPEAARLFPSRLVALLRIERVDLVDVTPSQLRAWLEAGLEEDRPRCVLVGGEAIDRALWRRLVGMAGTRFLNVYGPTECTVDATSCVVEGDGEPSLGTPLEGVRAYNLGPGWRPGSRGGGRRAVPGRSNARPRLSARPGAHRRALPAHSHWSPRGSDVSHRRFSSRATAER